MPPGGGHVGHARPRPSDGGPAPAALFTKDARPIGSCGEPPGLCPGGGRWQRGIWRASLCLTREVCRSCPGRTLAN